MLYGRPDDGKQTCSGESGVPLTSPELGELYLQNMASTDAGYVEAKLRADVSSRRQAGEVF